MKFGNDLQVIMDPVQTAVWTIMVVTRPTHNYLMKI